jgi:hypothetical protein
MSHPPCGWEPFMGCCPDFDGLSPEVQDMAKTSAIDIVWRLSGMQFGLCETRLRPCSQPCMSSMYLQAYMFTLPGFGGYNVAGFGGFGLPIIFGGQWYNISCGCSGLCNCMMVGAVTMPPRCDDVIEVLVDGIPLDPDLYVLVNGKLARTDNNPWPLCQDLTKPATEVGTWQVTYTQGRPVPVNGNLAAGVLACELGRLCAGLKCRLPARVTDITREGVSMTMLDPQNFLVDGLTGLREVDQFLASVNPYKLKSVSKVWSPDLPIHSRQF